jgi:hypothetical protein
VNSSNVFEVRNIRPPLPEPPPPTGRELISTILIKIAIAVITFSYGYWRYYPELVQFRGTDYAIYQSIYLMLPDAWYLPGTFYYYSPFFYIVFFLIRYLSFSLYIGIGVLFYAIGLILTAKRLNLFLWTIISINCGMQFWIFYLYGNMDLFLFGIIVWTFQARIPDQYKGLIIGLCLFKGTVAYTIPFFVYFAKERKKFIYLVILGAFVNYGYFLWTPHMIPIFFSHIMMTDHPHGLQYLLGYHYPWLWSVILSAIQAFFDWRNYKPYTKAE